MTSSPRASELQQAIQHGIGEPVRLANVRTGLRHLRDCEFEAVVLDQTASIDAEITNLLQHAGTAVPVTINSALSNGPRIVSEVKNALNRRRLDRVAARRAAGRELRDDLRNAVTGILLSSELALAAPLLPVAAQTRLRQVIELAEGMKRSLDVRPSHLVQDN